MSCTPIGSPQLVCVGTTTTGSPTNEIGCVNRPRCARDGRLDPPISICDWPILGATIGVAAATRMSTRPNNRRTASR